MKNSINILILEISWSYVTENVCIIDYSKISLEYFDEEHLVLSASIENVSHKDYLKIVSDHMNYFTLNNLNVGYSIEAMISKDSVLKLVAKNHSFFLQN